MTGRVVAVVLAGGEGRRMGGVDKSLLQLAGRPLLSMILDALAPLPAAINANGDPTRFAAFDLPVLPDGPFAGEGPLAGVLTALDWGASQDAAAVLTVPGDTPLIPRGLACALTPAPACAGSRGQAHHLVGLWPVACRDRLRMHLSGAGSRRVERFAAAIGMRVVDFPAEAWDPFLNVNTPDDLAGLRALVRATRCAAGGQEGVE
ncbi:MAG: molybdenum cofactor guanylyltransferase [Acetobacteraceae bacterium]